MQKKRTLLEEKKEKKKKKTYRKTSIKGIEDYYCLFFSVLRGKKDGLLFILLLINERVPTTK